MKKFLELKTAGVLSAAIALAMLAFWPLDGADCGIVGGGFIGSEECGQCHRDQFKSWQDNSRKSKSWETISAMRNGLTDNELKGCYECHTTGYGRETGFVSEEKTPHLKNVGCESCHGPGKLHSETQEFAHIVKTTTIDVCQRCHEKKDEIGLDQVNSFRYKGVIYAGAH